MSADARDVALAQRKDELGAISANARRAELAKHDWKVDYVAVRNGLGLRIPHPEGYDHANLLIVLGAAKLGATRLIDNVDVVPGSDIDAVPEPAGLR